MRLAGVLLTVFGATLSCAQAGFAQSSEELRGLREELERIKEGQRTIQQDLQEIKSLLQGRRAPAPAPPRNVVLSVRGEPFKGDKNARVTLIEFSDYQCPFCARHARDTLPQIEREYITTGKVKYVFRNFPIDSIHPQAPKAHEAASCAGEQGKYWEMHDRLFRNQSALSASDLSDHSRALGLGDPLDFQKCLDTGRYTGKVKQDVVEGQGAGVTGTPTFFLGVTAPEESQVKAVRAIRGAQPYGVFKEAIESLLNATK